MLVFQIHQIFRLVGCERVLYLVPYWDEVSLSIISELKGFILKQFRYKAGALGPANTEEAGVETPYF